MSKDRKGPAAPVDQSDGGLLEQSSAPVAVEPQVATPVADAAPVQQLDTSYPLALDEFCKQLSITDKRVSLIGSFYFVEKSAGRLRDNSGAYKARYESFTKQPA